MTTLLAPAKANLFLAIRGRDASGYHEIETVFVRLPESITKPDKITLESAAELQIDFQPAFDIDPKNNTLTKAVQLLEQKAGRHFFYKITVQKNIPPGSGLGGGSSDAAALLLHLNKHEQLGLTHDELLAFGAQVGMDVPFFLSGYKVALGTHYGEVLTPLPALPPNIQLRIELGKNPSSTKKAFELWDSDPHPTQKTAAPLIKALHNQDQKKILESLHNDFQSLFQTSHAQDQPREVAVLSGSGSAFAILTNHGSATQATHMTSSLPTMLPITQN